jgi:sporulation protein YlmC with PRC-barrel domain
MIRVSELLGKEIVTEIGWSLGHVFDVRVELGRGAPRVLGLVAGAPGLRRRLVGEAGRQHAGILSEGIVPWEAVVAIEDDRVRVKEVPSPAEGLGEEDV